MDYKEYLAVRHTDEPGNKNKRVAVSSIADDYLKCRHKDIKSRSGMPRKQLINILNASERRKHLKEIPARTAMESLVIRRSM